MRNSIHERALTITDKDGTSTFQELLHKDNCASFFIFFLNLFQYITRICETFVCRYSKKRFTLKQVRIIFAETVFFKDSQQ